MAESIRPVRNDAPPPEVKPWRTYDEQRRREVEDTERRQEGPAEEGKGKYVDVVA